MDEASRALFKKFAMETFVKNCKFPPLTYQFFDKRCDEYKKVLASLAAILQNGVTLPSQDSGRLKNVIAEIESLLAKEEEERERRDGTALDWHLFSEEYEGTSLAEVHRAWHYVALKYQGQCYPGTDLPYLTHIVEVLLYLSQALQTEPLLDAALAQCCAILRDTVNANTTMEEIEKSGFGYWVVNSLDGLIRDKDKGDDAIHDTLVRIKAGPKEVWLVEMADRVANLYRLHNDWTHEKCLAYMEESQLILDALGEASSVLAKHLSECIEVWKMRYGEQ
jgi:(p)ppGpp synthase/HD superfamily hydrolase